ncbi:hypothetical protein D3C84_1209200 [compost metagenome]
MVFGSLPPETLAFMGIGAWAMPGISVMTSFAPENWVTRFSEKCSSILSGAGPTAPSCGVEESNFGCA